RSLWPRIVEDARRERPMLGALLPAVEPSAIDGATVAVRALDPVHAEGLERQRDSLALLIGRYVTAPVRIKLEGAGSGERSAPRPGRLTAQGVAAESVGALLAGDAGLGAGGDV